MSEPETDEDYSRRRDAVYEVLISIPWAPSSLPEADKMRWLRHMSGELAHASITGDTSDLDFEGMKRKREREKLREAKALARKLSRAVQGLHYHTRGMLEYASYGTRFSDMQQGLDGPPILDADRDFWRRFWQTLATLDRTFDKAIPEAEAWIDDAPDLGKREQRIVAIVDCLRTMWRSITNKDPPMNISWAGPFADFLAESFKALNIEGNPRAAMDSWRKMHS